MLRRATYLLVPVLLAACAPQQRLARLLALHPELRADTTIVLHDTIATTYAAHDTVFALPTCADTLQPSNAEIKTDITVVAGNARATLAAEADGRFRLKAESLPDTVAIAIERKVPLFITKIERVPQPLTKWQQFKMHMGSVFLGVLAFLLLLTVLKIVLKFV